MYATIAICAAIANRAVTGKGQWIDVALLDSCVAFLANQAMNYFATGESPGRIGNAHPNIVPYQTFKTADGAHDPRVRQRQSLQQVLRGRRLRAISRKDPRFSTNGERVKNRDEITRLLNEIFAKRPTREWVKLLDDAGVANGPINTIEQVFEEPQVAGARHEDRTAACGRGQGAAGREPDAVFRHADQARSAAAGAGAAHR